MNPYLTQLSAVLWKDLTLEVRSPQRITAMAGFAVLVAVLFNFSLDQGLVSPQDIAAAMIWLTIVFGGMLGLGRTFQMDDEEAALEGILLSPIPRDALYLAKVLSNLAVLLLVELLTFASFWLFFGLDFGHDPLSLAAVILLASIGFVAVGTLFSGIASRTTMGDSLLPILVFPMLLPVIVYGVTATARIFAGLPASEYAGNLRMLGAYAIVAVVAGMGLFRYVVEE